MKKRVFFVLACFLFSILLINIVHSAIEDSINDVGSGIDNTVNSVQDIKNTATDSDLRTQYLKQEWRKILDKTSAGRVLLSVSDFFKNFNPLFKIILGVEYSLSWQFIFAVVIWLALFFFINKPLEAFFNGRLFGLIAGFIIVSLVGVSGVIKKAVDMLSFAINNIWIALLSFVIAIIVAVLLEKQGIKMKKIIEKKKEQAEKEKEKKNRKILDIHAKASKKELEGDGSGI